MGLLPSSQRDQTKVAVALVAVALAGYYYSYPYAAHAAALETMRTHVETLDAQNTKARAQASRNDVAKLRAEAERTGASLGEMRRLVPTEHEVPALLEEISTAARRAGLEVSGVVPDPVLRGEELDTYRYKITLVGGYHPLTAFLANVGSLERIVAPVAFGLTVTNEPARAARPGKVAPLAATVTLQAYVAHAPAPRADSAATSAANGEVETPKADVTPKRAAASKSDTRKSDAKRPAKPVSPSVVVIEREVFSYAGGGRRDPFKSLYTTSELRPTIGELRLVAVAYDPTGSSVAILRDLNTKEQHRVRVGTLLGRMRVSGIRPKAVVFTIEELGFSRQETLGLNDSTAVRTR